MALTYVEQKLTEALNAVVEALNAVMESNRTDAECGSVEMTLPTADGAADDRKPKAIAEFRAKYDGVCCRCGGHVRGFVTHNIPRERADKIAWSRTKRSDGLRGVMWHTQCDHLADDPAVIAQLAATQRKGDTA